VAHLFIRSASAFQQWLHPTRCCCLVAWRYFTLTTNDRRQCACPNRFTWRRVEQTASSALVRRVGLARVRSGNQACRTPE